MSKSSLAHPARDHVLVRVHADGREEPVSEHPSFEEGWAAGQHAVHADRQGAFALYRGGLRVARFGFNRIAVRHQSLDWSVLG
ncbi:MAG: hypothetical protein M3N18_13900 [Actinomycetota bacterium]|nr:hypothetical protein [Actinomycetota bacterium]